MACQIVLNLSEREYDHLIGYVARDATAAAIFLVGIVGREQALAMMGEIGPDVPKPEPENPADLADGWGSPEHRRFYREVMRQAHRILREAAQGKGQ